MNGYPCSRQRRVEARQTILESERIYLRLDRANESVAFMALQHVIKPCMGQRSFEFVLSSFSPTCAPQKLRAAARCNALLHPESSQAAASFPGFATLLIVEVESG